MKIFKKFLTIAAIILIIGNNYCMATGIDKNSVQNLPIKIGLFSKDLNDDYLIFLRSSFENIQKENEGKVVFSFYNAKYNQSTQDNDIATQLNKGIDLILLDIVDTNEIENAISKIKQYNVPVIIFNREPLTMDAIKSYKKALYVGTDSKQAGILQGKMIIDAWNSYKDFIDKNGDNTLQYILLNGEKFNKSAIDRSKFSISTINQAGIKTEELASPYLNWDTEAAYSTVGSLFLRYGDKIEAIISNDDSMAIGAVKALQKYGYNNGDKTKTILVVGIDAVPQAKELISKGFMLGSPFQDPLDMVNAIYTIGMNLVYNKNPIENTPYKLDETGSAVLIPFQEYSGPMFKD